MEFVNIYQISVCIVSQLCVCLLFQFVLIKLRHCMAIFSAPLVSSRLAYNLHVLNLANSYILYVVLLYTVFLYVSTSCCPSQLIDYDGNKARYFYLSFIISVNH